MVLEVFDRKDFPEIVFYPELVVKPFQLLLRNYPFLKHFLEDPLLLLVFLLFEVKTYMAVDLYNQMSVYRVVMLPLIQIHSLHKLHLPPHILEPLISEYLLYRRIRVLYFLS